MNEAAVRQAFLTQRDFCLAMDAPVTARVCEALAQALDRATATGRRVLDWAGEPIADALPLRLVGGLNALAQAGDVHAAVAFGADTALSRTVAALRAVLGRHDRAILPWLDGPPQTNEAGRSGPLMLGLMAVTRAFGHPIELLEIGSSAGLNLLIDRFAFDLGGVRIGPQGSTITIVPEWRGPPPEPASPRFASIRGVDVSPIDVTDPAQAARLRSYVWGEKPERLARIDAAIAMLRERSVRLEAGDAADWVEARLAEPQAEGTTRVLTHSVVWQYLGTERQARIAAAMRAAGARADAKRPLAWVRMEPDRDLARHEIWVENWPGDATRRIGLAHAHGAWVAPD
ncbi:DUF2332 domain-containing protein [Sphingomonas aestuarii]